jgi:hypothetical protein
MLERTTESKMRPVLPGNLQQSGALLLQAFKSTHRNLISTV